MEVFKINKIVFNSDDLQTISTLRETCEIINLVLQKNEEHLFTENYFKIISNIATNLTRRLKNENITDSIIDDNLAILKDLENIDFKNYLEALTNFLNQLERFGISDISEIDNTLNKEFNLNINPRKNNTNLNFKIKKIKTGWSVFNPDSKNWVESNKFCDGLLFSLLKNNSINYPHDLRGYLKWLWDASTAYNYTETEVSKEFDELSKWINICNDYSPNTKLGGYR